MCAGVMGLYVSVKKGRQHEMSMSAKRRRKFALIGWVQRVCIKGCVSKGVHQRVCVGDEIDFSQTLSTRNLNRRLML